MTISAPRAVLLITAILAAPATGQAIEPYQHGGGINVGSCGGPQCRINFPAVPAGKRLMLTSISAQLGPAATSFVMEGGSVTYFVPMTNPATGVLAQPVTLFYEPGQAPVARIFVPNQSQSTSLVVTLVGTLVPAK